MVVVVEGGGGGGGERGLKGGGGNLGGRGLNVCRHMQPGGRNTIIYCKNIIP